MERQMAPHRKPFAPEIPRAAADLTEDEQAIKAWVTKTKKPMTFATITPNGKTLGEYTITEMKVLRQALQKIDEKITITGIEESDPRDV
jgi:hypothetical protein